MQSLFQYLLCTLILTQVDSSLWGSWFGGGSSSRTASRGFLHRAEPARPDVMATYEDAIDFEEDVPVEALSMVQVEASYTKTAGPKDVYTKEIMAKVEELKSPTTKMAAMLGITEPMPQFPQVELTTSPSNVSTGSDSTRLSARLTVLGLADANPMEPSTTVAASAGSAAAETMDAEAKLAAFPSWEAKLIETLATDDEEDARPCLAHCRYGEETRHSWSECIERCAKYDLTKRMLYAGLPTSEHAAVHLEAEVPAGMEEMKKKKKRSARAEEL